MEGNIPPLRHRQLTLTDTMRLFSLVKPMASVCISVYKHCQRVCCAGGREAAGGGCAHLPAPGVQGRQGARAVQVTQLLHPIPQLQSWCVLVGANNDAKANIRGSLDHASAMRAVQCVQPWAIFQLTGNASISQHAPRNAGPFSLRSRVLQAVLAATMSESSEQLLQRWLGNLTLMYSSTAWNT